MDDLAALVVVTHHGVGPTVRGCLESVAAARHRPALTVVVDNSGRDASTAEHYGPGVTHVVRVENRGFGAGANAGIREVMATSASTSPSLPIAVLNDDIEVDPGWLMPLLDALGDDAGLGAVQPALLRAGSDRINSLGVELDRYGAGVDIGLDEPSSTLGADRPIDIFTGGAVLFRPAFLRETGGFDERYFLYYEDVDLALRGAEAGWRYRCVTSSRVSHRGGASTSSLGDDVLRYRERNRLWTVARFGAASTVARALWLSVRRLRHRPRGIHARALASGVVGMPAAFARRLSSRRRGAARRSSAGS